MKNYQDPNCHFESKTHEGYVTKCRNIHITKYDKNNKVDKNCDK